MSEFWRIVLTASITIAGGVIVYTIGHLFVAVFVEPIHRLRSLIGEIADSLVFYANVYSNPGLGQKERMDEASETLRHQASQLRAREYSVPWYSLWSFMGLVREKAKIEEASAELIGLSNSVHRSEPNLGIQNYRRQEKIKELLGIKSSATQSESQSVNKYTLSWGIIFFLFGLIMWGVQNGPSTVVLGLEIPTFSLEFYRAFGIVATLISVLFVIATFQKQLATKLVKFLEERARSRWQGAIQWLFWVVFWLVYIVGWLKGFSSISVDGFFNWVAFWMGFILFWIIPIVWLKMVFKRRQSSVTPPF